MANEKIVPVKEKAKQTPPKEGLEKKTEKHDEYSVEIVRDFYGKIDPFYLANKNPNFAYRFLRDDTKSGGKNISTKTSNLLFQKGGWQICPKEHLIKKLGIKESEFSADGLLRRGDTVLAFMPIQLFKEKEAHKQKMANAPMDAIKRRTEKGIPGEGIQTKKDLRGNWK